MQHITATKVPDIVRFINDIEIRFVVGYPSIIYSFCQLVEDLGLKMDTQPMFMFPSAEKLYEHQREQILRVFPAIRIMEHYGFSENAASASKCLCGNYHEDYELGHMELSDADFSGRDLTGKLLATGYRNLGMPFIRYDVGDTVTFSSEKCSCGLCGQRIVDIEGRNEDFILTPEGTRIMRLDYLFKDTRSIKECQVVQKHLGEITIVIVRRENYTIATERRIIEAVHTMVSPFMKVDFEYVDAIPRTRAGKFKAVVSLL